MLILLFFHFVFSEIILPTTSKDTYKVIQLNNSLSVSLISCNDCSIAGVSMAVKVGSSHDSVSGIAHFLEHMLFFSSKTYPQEDYLTTFVNNHGGYTNAFTEYEETVYFYSVSNQGLKDSLHVFSRVFVEPLFLENTIAREINAVYSEIEGNQYDDNWKAQKLIEKVTGRPINNEKEFDINSLSVKSLKNELFLFWNKHYKANNMKLAIFGNFSIETMQEWAESMYSDIRPQGSFEILPNTLGLGNYASALKLTPGKQIIMLWKLTPLNYEYQSSDFIGYLLQFSLTQTLSKVYPGSLYYAGSYVDLNSLTLFAIEAIFSNSDYNTTSVCRDVLASIKALKTLKNDTFYSLWKDYQKLYFNDFNYSDPLQGADIASTVASNMLHYPEELYYAGNSIKLQYSYENIIKTLNELSENAVLTTVLTDSPEYPTNMYEKSLKMDYFLSNWTIQSSETEFSQLQTNPYLPESLTLIENDYNTDLTLYKNTTHRIWYKYNKILKKPFVMISALVFIPDWNDYKIVSKIHVNIVLEMIRNQLIYYFLAGYNVKITVESPGVVISISGWNEGIYGFLSKILQIYTNPNIELFNTAYQSSLYSLLALETEESYQKTIDWLNRLITQYYLTTEEQLSLILNTTYEDYLYFTYIIADCSIDLLVLGNSHPPESLLSILSSYFNPTKTTRLYKHSLGITGYHIFASSATTENAILNWYEFGSYSAKTYVAVSILEILTSDQAFISLRSQAQLGYTVLMDHYDGFLTNGIYLIVQGNSYNPKEMQEYITKFWNKASLNKENFLNVKNDLKTRFALPNNFQDIHDQIWFEIIIGRLGFCERQKVLEEIDRVSFDDVLDVLKLIQLKTNQLSIRLYMNLTQSHEESISLDFFRYQ